MAVASSALEQWIKDSGIGKDVRHIARAAFEAGWNARGNDSETRKIPVTISKPKEPPYQEHGRERGHWHYIATFTHSRLIYKCAACGELFFDD